MTIRVVLVVVANTAFHVITMSPYSLASNINALSLASTLAQTQYERIQG
jgi:hypothetical protein